MKKLKVRQIDGKLLSTPLESVRALLVARLIIGRMPYFRLHLLIIDCYGRSFLPHCIFNVFDEFRTGGVCHKEAKKRYLKGFKHPITLKRLDSERLESE